ncbi:MAG: uroporphyrinogen decarboxylase [Chloroflexi bacterium]|nr:uroporphyrinogen decarboxylase [Chloroflexota bacterium]
METHGHHVHAVPLLSPRPRLEAPPRRRARLPRLGARRGDRVRPRHHHLRLHHDRPQDPGRSAPVAPRREPGRPPGLRQRPASHRPRQVPGDHLLLLRPDSTLDLRSPAAAPGAGGARQRAGRLPGRLPLHQDGRLVPAGQGHPPGHDERAHQNRARVPRDQADPGPLLRAGRPGVHRGVRDRGPARVPDAGHGPALDRWAGLHPVGYPDLHLCPPPTAGSAGPASVRLLQALHLEPADCTPIWFMRQAGRALPEYRAVRERYSLLEVCRTPEVCAEVTLQPVRRLGVDAAILFADIMLPLLGVGIELEIVDGVGPVVADPIRAADGVAALRPLEPESDVGYVLEDIRCCLDLLGGAVPLIGFSGAPFTLASYLIEGKASRDFLQTKRMMYGAPDLWHDLMSRLAAIVGSYLRAQAEAGAHALQLFDSWVGALSLDDYCRYVQPYVRSVFAALRDTGVPAIHFGTGTAALLEAMREAGGTAIGVDWRVPLDLAWSRIGHDRGVQGNLDPLVLQGPWEVVRREAEGVLRRAAGRPGHVFNLGHGIHPQTPVEHLQRLVELVHERTAHRDT